MSHKLLYRPDIDGLRGISVLAVLLYHARLECASGGYVGVDVFFVISGYLITAIIYAELDAGEFKFRAFWIRRIRRIVPASLLVLVVTIAVFGFFYPPDLYQHLAQALLSQLVFASNIYFSQSIGYFTDAAVFGPFLHMWSLALEEQFYAIYPLFLWAAFRFGRRRIILAHITVLAGSLLLSIFEFGLTSLEAFYLLPTRAWEFLVGASLAIVGERYDSCSLRWRNVVSAMGICAITYAMFAYDNETPFPSFYAAVPVFGAGALIWANRNGDTALFKLLSFAPLVAVGLISYSLYLWHWPAIVLINWLYIDPSAIATLIAVLVCFVLATASYHWVEIPLRKGRARSNVLWLLTSAGTCTLVLVLAGIAIEMTDGWPNRNSNTKRLSQHTDFSQPPRNAECDRRFVSRPYDFLCRSAGFENGEGEPFLVWGDSHAGMFIPAFQEAADKTNRRFEFALFSACPPIQDVKVSTLSPGTQAQCKRFNESVLDYILESKIGLVILIWRQDYYVEQSELSGRPPTLMPDSWIDGARISRDSAFNAFSHGFVNTLNRLRKADTKVVVVRQLPTFLSDPKRVLEQHIMLGYKNYEYSSLLTRPRAEFEDRSRRSVMFFRSNDHFLLDFTDVFCDVNLCSSAWTDRNLYNDRTHISAIGASLLVESIVSFLNENAR